MGPISRRGLLVGAIGATVVTVAGGTGYELVQHGALPGKYQLDKILGACGGDPGVPAVMAGPVSTTRFYSQHRKRTVQMIVMRPPGVQGPLPVAIVLHGSGGDAQSSVSMGYPQYLAAAVAAGAPPFAVVAIDGGASTYWHRRASGDDPPGMITAEVLPRLRALGYLVGTIGIIGWSMGGYGALLLASQLEPARSKTTRSSGEAPAVAAVAAASPAIFTSYPAAIGANSASFDSPADFAANDVRSLARLAVLRRLPVRIDCGTDDPFTPQATLLRHDLANPPGAITSGCHDQPFWRRNLPAELSFLGQHLMTTRKHPPRKS
jgi:S-formylglutathione hydrolase FrmB